MLHRLARPAVKARTVFTAQFGIFIGLLVAITGCPTQGDMNGDGGDGGSFDSASDLPFDSAGRARLSASRLSGDEVDFYKLGTLNPGDRVRIDVQAASGDLDPVAALFDAEQNVLLFNDDRVQDGSDLNPLLNGEVFGATGDYVLGIAAFPGSGSSGEYTLDVSITRGDGAFEPQAQVVFFNWAGGRNLQVANVGTFNLDPFNATDVGLPASNTEALKDRVQALVADRYSRFNLVIVNSDDQAEPSGAHSTVHFGGFNRQAFAISEAIDTGNGNPNDDTIIFAESFNGAFSTSPSLEDMAVAMANTTAHEIGHLLGLIHTKQCNDLMDTTCGNDSILVSQAFERAPLDDSVFPTGFQDSGEVIGFLLGLAQM